MLSSLLAPKGAIVRRRRTVVATVLLGCAVSLGAALPSLASAEGPGSGPLWAVSIGDSYISGEGGRWAGNTNGFVGKTDALGPSAYKSLASGTAEEIEG